MAKPTKKERPESEGAGVRIVVSEVMLRGAAIDYAAVADLDPSHPRWRRQWRKLRRTAIAMVTEILKTAGPPEGTRALRRAGPGAVAPLRQVLGGRARPLGSTFSGEARAHV